MSTKRDNFSDKDRNFMKLALNLARARLGLTGNNPSVGCVVVKNNTVISNGVTSKNGRPHSEFNALNASDLVNFSPNKEAYVSYLRHLAVPNGSTGNENIQKVQPGEFIVIDFAGNLKKELYWDPFDYVTEKDITRTEAVDRLDELLKSSVEYRKISDVEVGLYLSGGLDSTLIGSLLAADTKIKSFNVDYDEIFDGYRGEYQEAKFSADQIEVDLIHKSISFEEFKSVSYTHLRAHET
mgnify:CR=1 FL=1